MRGNLTRTGKLDSNAEPWLSEDELRELGPPTRRVRAGKGQPLYLLGEPGGAIHLLESGRIKLLRICPDGKEFILHIVEPNEIFGEMSILYDEPEDTLAEAIERSCVWTYPWSRLQRLVRSNPDTAWRMARLIGWRCRKAEDRLKNIAFRSVTSRLASLLLQLGREYGAPARAGTILRIRLSQEDMGGLIGASREIVCQTLSEFRRRGFIDQEGRQLVIREPEPLAELA